MNLKRLMRAVRPLSNEQSLRTENSSTAEETATRKLTSTDGNRFAFGLDEAHRDAYEHSKDITTNENDKSTEPKPSDYLPSLSVKVEKILL